MFAMFYRFFGERNQYVVNEVLKEASARHSETKEDEIQGLYTCNCIYRHS